MNVNQSNLQKLTDSETTILDLREIVKQFVNERDWNHYHNPKDLTVALSIEVAELMEHFLFRPGETQPENNTAFMEEMADIFIYLMSLANSLDIDSFSQIVVSKMEKNRIKYPIEIYSGENYSKQ